MKDQYFGDVNDYRKYGLLRALCEKGKFRIGVCWMLTPGDGRGDGAFTEYLEDPDGWRRYDADLYDKLEKVVVDNRQREVGQAEEKNLLSRATYYPCELSDDREERKRYFNEFFRQVEDTELLFFDPDNGMEVKSVGYGRRHSSKYLYWQEFEYAMLRGYSVVIYQHFPHKNHSVFVKELAEDIFKRTEAPKVFACTTSYCVFFVVPQSLHVAGIWRSICEIKKTWRDQIQVQEYHRT